MTDTAKKRKNSVYLIVALIIAALLIWWTVTNTDSTSQVNEEEEHEHEAYIHFSPEEAIGYGVILGETSSTPLSIEVIANGKVILNPNAVAHIVPQAPGVVRTIYKNVGESVAANDLMAVIESREMAESKAAYLAAIKREILAATTLQRERNLYDEKISAGQDFFDAQAKAEEAFIELQLSKQRLEALGVPLEEIVSLSQTNNPNMRLYEVRSPIKGVVIQRHLTLGEVVTNDRDVFTIANMDDVWVELSAFPQDVSRILPGQILTITDAQGKEAKAKVLYTSPIIDEETRTATVTATLDNRKGEWPPGSFITARIVVNTIPVAVSVPKGAVQQVDGQPSVFVVQDDGFEIRPIRIGKSDSKHYEVISGLKTHEKVAYDNTFLLKAEHEKHEAEHMD